MMSSPASGVDRDAVLSHVAAARVVLQQLPEPARFAFVAGCMERQWPTVAAAFQAATWRGAAASFYRMLLDSTWKWVLTGEQRPSGILAEADRWYSSELEEKSGTALHESLASSLFSFAAAVDAEGDPASLGQVPQDAIEVILEFARSDASRVDAAGTADLVAREIRRQALDLAMLQESADLVDAATRIRQLSVAAPILSAST